MREPETCHIEYCGYGEPRTPEELEFEILGLETAVCEIKKRIATLKQSSYLVKIALREENDCNHSKKN